MATLARGGDPGHRFITLDQEERTAPTFEGERITFRPQWFHILDAIEFLVGQARTEADLLRIYRFYVKDPPEAPDLQVQPEALPTPFFNADELSIKDPRGKSRMEIFLSSLTKRQISLLREIREELRASDKAAIETLVRETKKHKGECYTKEVPRLGGDAIHNRFADLVTGRSMDFMIATAGPMVTFTDGFDSKDKKLVWEVKTRHQFLAEWALPGTIFSRAAQEAIMNIEAQRQTHMVVTANCGYRLAYAFDTLEVAEFFKRIWSNNPPVFYRQGP